MLTYKHFVTISSQLYFCASPIRLDSYNGCQFGCVYCFSRKRAQATSSDGLKRANPDAFAARLERVHEGIINSALDEFLKARVPIQLGGLQDPFSSIEHTSKTTLELLNVLNEYDYPTMISTKGNAFLHDEYCNVLQQMNVFFRLSAAAVPERYRAGIDVGCGSFKDTLSRIAFLKEIGIPVSLRIQPVFPGFETSALRMARQAAEVGVSHVSFEYLKLGTEGLKSQIKRISKVLDKDMWAVMQARGMKRLGRDYTLKAAAKKRFLKKAKQLCLELGVRFGAGDTEFIHLSDGMGCCNGSSFFLSEATQFRANFVGMFSNRETGSEVRFGDIDSEWCPEKDVHNYLTTNSRGRDLSGRFNSWKSLMAHRWNGDRSPYCPEFFHGVSWTGETDDEGFKVYEITEKL